MVEEKARQGYISLGEARERLKVSKAKMIKLVHESGVQLYDDPLDKRKKLIKNDDLDELIKPKEKPNL